MTISIKSTILTGNFEDFNHQSIEALAEFTGKKWRDILSEYGELEIQIRIQEASGIPAPLKVTADDMAVADEIKTLLETQDTYIFDEFLKNFCQ